MTVRFTSATHVFSLDDLTGTFSGLKYTDLPSMVDLTGTVMPTMTDKDGNILYGIDSEFGFQVYDFRGAEDKILDGDYAEGFAGNIYDPIDGTTILGLAMKNAETDVFKTGAPLGTWSLGIGGETVKASTEHYSVMQDILSDQKYPGDPTALGPLDDDLRILDLRPVGQIDGVYAPGVLHQLWVKELSQALQAAIDNANVAGADQILADLDFNRDGVLDTYRITTAPVDFDSDGDGVLETNNVGAVDIGNDGTIDMVDKWLNGFGTTADVTDLLDPNESSSTYDIAYSQDYSVTVKDDGKLLYRWGEAIKRPNDLRMDIKLELPEEWTRDNDNNGVADSVENGARGFYVHSARLVVDHDITNNPNDQIRPEDYENEAAIGRLPAHYVVIDPEDATNILWVSPVNSYSGSGDFLPSYFRLTETGAIDLVPQAGDVAVADPDGNVVGFRNKDASGNLIGTVLRDYSLIDLAEAADLKAVSEDLAEGFTAAWYTTVDREPFEWSYDKFADDPFKQVFESFRTPEDAAAAGYTEDQLVSGPRWRITPNKFGQDLPGLEVPLEPNTQPPYQRDNIKYETGERILTTINLLDWEGTSPLQHSDGWMLVDPTRLDENGDGLIDEGWLNVNDGSGTLLAAGDAMPTGPILSAVTPNGMNLTHEFFDTAVYLKGDRSDSAKYYDMYMEIEYAAIETIGAVQQVTGVKATMQTVSYQDGQVFNKAVAFVTPLTQNGKDAASVTISSVTTTGVDLRVEEPDSYDGTHVREDFSLMTFEEGSWNLADGTKIEVGTTFIPAGVTERFFTVNFEQAFKEAPIVVVQLQTDNDPDWAIARVRNVTETGFQFALQEQEANDLFHAADEILGWFAIDAADADGLIDWDGLVAQTFRTTANQVPGTQTFDAALGLDPLISAAMNTTNGTDPAVLRLTSLVDDGTAATASFLVQEEKSFDTEVRHNLETIGGIAFDQAGLLTGFGAMDSFIFA